MSFRSSCLMLAKRRYCRSSNLRLSFSASLRQPLNVLTGMPSCFLTRKTSPSCWSRRLRASMVWSRLYFFGMWSPFGDCVWVGDPPARPYGFRREGWAIQGCAYGFRGEGAAFLSKCIDRVCIRAGGGWGVCFAGHGEWSFRCLCSCSTLAWMFWSKATKCSRIGKLKLWGCFGVEGASHRLAPTGFVRRGGVRRAGGCRRRSARCRWLWRGSSFG